MVAHPLINDILGGLSSAQLNRLSEESGIPRVTLNSWLYEHKTPRIDLLCKAAEARGFKIMVRKPDNKMRIINSAKGRIEAWQNNKIVGYVENDILYGMDAQGYANPIGSINHRVEISAKLGVWRAAQS